MPPKRLLIRIAKQKLLRKKAARSQTPAASPKAKLLEETKARRPEAKQNGC
jgi:hypothetical protein